MTDSTEPITIQLSVDWGAGPLWVKVGHEAADNYLADEITEVVPLSDELRAAIETWDERYQQRLNKDDPAASRKFTPDEETEFTAEGTRGHERKERSTWGESHSASPPAFSHVPSCALGGEHSSTGSRTGGAA